MSLTDPVADFLARIRNAIRARHQKLDVPASKLKTEIARILKEEGYISNYKTQEEEGKLVLRVYLKYGGQEPAIRDLRAFRDPAAGSTWAATRSSASRADWASRFSPRPRA